MAEHGIAFPALIWSMAALGNDGSGGGGEGGTVSVIVNSTTTIEAGQPARVENIGTDTNVVLDFFIPAGENGTNGEAGTNGSKWYTSTSQPGTIVSGAVDGDFILYSDGKIYQVINGVPANTNINIMGSRWIVVNTPPSTIISNDYKEGDCILFNTGDIYRVTGGRLVSTSVNIKGPTGNDGFSPTIEVKEDTEDSYVLTITNSNGSYDTPNLKGSGTGTCDPYQYAVNIGYTGTREEFDDAFLKMLNFFSTDLVTDGTGSYTDPSVPTVNGNVNESEANKIIFDGGNSISVFD